MLDDNRKWLQIIGFICTKHQIRNAPELCNQKHVGIALVSDVHYLHTSGYTGKPLYYFEYSSKFIKLVYTKSCDDSIDIIHKGGGEVGTNKNSIELENRLIRRYQAAYIRWNCVIYPREISTGINRKDPYYQSNYIHPNL